MNGERFGFGKPSINFSPMKIISEGAGDIHVRQIQHGMGKADTKIGLANSAVQSDATGSLTLHIGKNEMRMPHGGMVTVPDGATVEAYKQKDKDKTVRFDVYGTENTTMVKEPNTSKFRPIEGKNPETREGFFWENTGPEMGAWDEKNPLPRVERQAAETILGFNLEPLVKAQILKQPKKAIRGADAFALTERDVITAYRANRTHEMSDAPWRLIANVVRSPLSLEEIQTLKSDMRWNEVVARAKTVEPRFNFDHVFTHMEQQARNKK